MSGISGPVMLISITASTSKLVLAAVFALTAGRFAVAGGYDLSGSTSWERLPDSSVSCWRCG